MRIGIITINDDNNYGNRLQNFAIQEVMRKLGIDVVTIKNNPILNKKKIFLIKIYQI